MFEVRVESHFSSAHHLLNYDGECENQHGHNWKVEVCVRGETLDKSNILMDFKILKQELNKIMNTLDHKDLNELESFQNQSPSSEMLCQFIYFELKKTIPLVSRVNVFETPTSCASYFERD